MIRFSQKKFDCAQPILLHIGKALKVHKKENFFGSVFFIFVLFHCSYEKYYGFVSNFLIEPLLFRLLSLSRAGIFERVWGPVMDSKE